MFYQFLLYLIITWFISQTCKFLFKSWRNKSFSDARNTYLYYSGPPSSHSAVLSMTLFYVKNKTDLNDPVFLVFVVFSTLWIYEIYMQRKRFVNFVRLISVPHTKQKEVALNQEFHGHARRDILAGLILGSIIYFLLEIFTQ